MPFTLDYDRWIHLDAEDLAETGIREAYERLLPELRKHVPQPAQVEEVIDNDTPRYSVRCGTREYAIYGPELDEPAKRGRSQGGSETRSWDFTRRAGTESGAKGARLMRCGDEG
jgi:hypothetical protein